MKFQQHVRCSSVQCYITKKSYLMKNPNFPVKKWCLAFNALFDVSNIVWPCFTSLYLQNILLSQVWSTCFANLHLMRKKRWQSLYIFLQLQDQPKLFPELLESEKIFHLKYQKSAKIGGSLKIFQNSGPCNSRMGLF